MFTGIVEEVGTVRSIERLGSGWAQIEVEAKIILPGTKIGDSIAIDGVCQTIKHIGSHSFIVDTLAESLKKTTLGFLRSGSKVNLERALRFDGRMDGHFVQGHVSGVARIQTIQREKNNVYFTFSLSPSLLHYCVPEGSIALDGISLTIASIQESTISVNLIPVTLERTTWKYKREGDFVNVETDIIGRYVEKFLGLKTHQSRDALTWESFRGWNGFSSATNSEE
ncbi:MAG: riboflavin synthase [Spirochaetes bacterium]|nr:riboflavin synthase [Spirochaetota bacterium]